MPRKKDGTPFEISPSPMKDDEGRNLLYVRPMSGRSVTLEELDDYCCTNMGMPRNMLINAFNIFHDAILWKLADGARIETPIGSFYPTLRLRQQITNAAAIQSDDVSLQTIRFRPSKSFVQAVRKKGNGFHPLSTGRRTNGQLYRKQDELNKALDAAFAERDDLTIKFFCHCAGITKYAALKYLNSLCEGEQPFLRRVQLGRTYVYKRLS